MRGGFLVSASWRTEALVKASFEDIETAVQAIPGWRAASILADPAGIAESLQAAARAWSWERFEPGLVESTAATMITRFAEEVHKLARAMDRGDLVLAAVQRSVLARRLALPVAIHPRILFESENDLWRLGGETMGAEWIEAQKATCTAAVTLFALACESVRPAMSGTQQKAVDRAFRFERRIINLAARVTPPFRP